jgi:hypothetical protein
MDENERPGSGAFPDDTIFSTSCLRDLILSVFSTLKKEKTDRCSGVEKRVVKLGVQLSLVCASESNEQNTGSALEVQYKDQFFDEVAKIDAGNYIWY